ncbi:hypothetical protein JCM10207_002252 [Rhodosporidiobolus poonsookiae]
MAETTMQHPASPSSLRSPILGHSTHDSLDHTSSRPTSVIIHNVRGAEGGVEAITARRRNSGSFKHMSTGSLVSNSPFAQRLGTVKPTPAPAPTPQRQTGLYGGESRIPTAVNGNLRKLSGSRRASGEQDGPVKENSNPSDLNELGLGGGKADDSISRRSASPSVPFKPTKHAPPTSSAPSAQASSALPSSTSPFKPTRPTFGARRQPSQDDDAPRRQSSSYAALRKNGLVSSSPFTSSANAPSPELQQAPYEIGPLSHESAPFGYEQTSPDLAFSSFAPSSPSKASGQMGLGARPGQGAPAANDRRIVGGIAAPPPNSPGYEHRQSLELGRSPPSSSLSPMRRGMRGPRAMTGDSAEDDGEETEREELGRTLRRQPSNKTVTWAETEEVLEFEVEEERRRSMMSDASTVSDDERRYYGHNSSDEDDSEDEIYANHVANGSFGFEEGGSVEVHDIDSDAEDSVVSTGSSAMDDMIDQIDSYIHEGESYDVADVFSPSQIPSFTGGAGGGEPDLPSHRTTPGYASPLVSPRPPQPQSAFSMSSGSAADEGGSEVSASSYGDGDDEEEEPLRHAREQILARARASMTQAPGSPGRPLPTPPLQQAASFPPPVSAAPAHLGAPALIKSDSQYSLPDIPGTSPFLGFQDDGTAGSVVTLQDGAVPTTKPLQPHSTPAPATPAASSAPSQSTPTSATSTSLGDSPILSALNRPSSPATEQTSPALSRKASLVGSDVSNTTSSISWYGSSVNGSLRGGTVRLGRDRLEERMKAHQALFGTGEGSPVASFGAFPSPASSSPGAATAARSTPPASSSAAATAGVEPFSRAMETTQSAPSASRPHAIEARPAPKARSATLSSSMLPTIAASPQRSRLGVHVGDPLTADVAEEMQSPLERLQLGVRGKEVGAGQEGETGMWRSGDSLLGVNEVAEDEEAPQMVRSGSGSAMEEREQAIIAKRREKAALEGGLGVPASKKGRRRSRSTGDADVAETVSVPMENVHTMPELGFEQRIGRGDDGFAIGALESLEDIYNARNRTYRVRESKRLVVVSDFAGSKAGDVDPGRAWRKKRPSDVHAINRSFSTMSIGSQQARRTRELSGQLFVHFRDVSFDNLPMPRQPVKVTASLDNGRQRVDAAVRDLGAKISLKKEFELVCSENLAFSIHFSTPSVPPPAPVFTPSPAPTPPASPSKPHRALRIFSSPKKRNATPTRAPAPAPPPARDPFYDYVSSDGQLATARVVFANEAAHCRLKKTRIVVPFGQKATPSTRACSGSLVVELLFVPAVPGVPKAQLPKSMDEVTEGLELADWATKVTHESVLTQLGGDCSVWRRRLIKLRGSTLVPYSEVTKRSHVEINLALVASIEDLNTPTMPTPGSRSTIRDEDEDVGRMDNSFRLGFKDGARIDFFADTAVIKAQWIEILNKVVGKAENKKTPPEWAIAARKLPPPKPAAT